MGKGGYKKKKGSVRRVNNHETTEKSTEELKNSDEEMKTNEVEDRSSEEEMSQKSNNNPMVGNGRDIYDRCMIIIAILTFVASCYIGGKANELNKKNQALVISDIDITDENDTTYICSIKKEQGEIKKAFLVTDFEGIQYKKLDESLGNIEIPKRAVVDKKTVEEIQESDYTVTTDLEDALINDVIDFAVVLLDYSDRWSCYYVAIRPGIDLSNAELTITVRQEGVEEPVGKETAKLISVPPEYKILETEFVNKGMVEDFIKKFEESYEIQVLADDMKIQVKSIDDEGKIQIGEVTKGKEVTVKYRKLDAEKILNTINTILEDCQ